MIKSKFYLSNLVRVTNIILECTNELVLMTFSPDEKSLGIMCTNVRRWYFDRIEILRVQAGWT